MPLTKTTKARGRTTKKQPTQPRRSSARLSAPVDAFDSDEISSAQEEEVVFLTSSEDEDLETEEEEEEEETPIRPVLKKKAVKAEIDDEEEARKAAWTATSRKRKEIFERSNAHLQPLAKKPRALEIPRLPNAPRTQRITAKPSPFDQKNTRIDWAGRKLDLENSDNIAFVDPLVGMLMETFQEVAQDVRRGDLAKVGPVFLWALLPAFVMAIEKTPWGYWFDGGNVSDDGDHVMFINWNYGEKPADLSEPQKKFRLACLMKVKVLFESKIQNFMSNDRLVVRYSK